MPHVQVISLAVNVCCELRAAYQSVVALQSGEEHGMHSKHLPGSTFTSEICL